jgi:transposase
MALGNLRHEEDLSVEPTVAPIGVRHRRGRPPGIAAERRQRLAELVRCGLSVSEIAKILGVSRQCAYVQLRKCGELEHERRIRRVASRLRQRAQREWRRGMEWIENKAHGGPQLADLLRRLSAMGWKVEARPRHRPRINGTCVAFHQPRRLRASGSGKSRYYHVQLTRPDWWHVVYLPTGRYVFFPPDLTRPRGSHYIPEHVAHEPQEWSDWQILGVSGLAPSADQKPAWAA